MHVFVGLGNPDSKYADTKHNAGFWVLDELSRRWNIPFRPGKGDYLYGKSKSILMIKPTTGMNNSGIAVKQAMAYFAFQTEDIVVVLDDVDLPLGKIRVRPKGGDGCHRGLESVIYHIGTTGFPRFRYGISTGEKTRPAEHFVLKPFRKSDKPLAAEMVHSTADAVESFLKHGITFTMNTYNS